MTDTSASPGRVTALYDAIDAFQRQHRTAGGLQHAQIRALLAEHLDKALPQPAAPQSPADRAAVLREAADHLARQADELWAPGTTAHTVMHADATELRRMANEAQPAEAHPAEHTWAAELYDPVAKEWVPGTRYTDRDRAVNHLNHAAKIGPAWKGGTPTQRRLVRATTTYTVEQPAAGARQDGVQQ